jgi:hypothetical protein
MNTTSARTRITAAISAVAVATLLLGGTAVGMTADAGPTNIQVVKMESVVITATAIN